MMKCVSVCVSAFLLMSSMGVAQEKTADEIAKELANPATPMSSLGNNFEFKTYDGNLPGAGDQESLTYTFQPSFPFPQSNGKIIALRPAIPLLIDQPVIDDGPSTLQYPGASVFEDVGPELGDIAFDFIYGGTSPEGLISMVGIFGVIPTATDDSVGIDQWRLGPEFLLGIAREWGVLGALVFHQWDVGGDNDTPASITSFNYLYALNLGDGLQLAAGPTITYDWEAESDDAWTVPLGVGLAKTVIAGKMPLKMQLQGFYNVESPDSYATDWGLKLSITPVVKNPFIR